MIDTRQILEEFELKSVLATSATGAVFLAGDRESGRDVVVKMVSCAVPNAEEKVRRLFLEMVEKARLGTIRTMPALTDHGLTPEGDGFVVMDLVEGRPLDSIDEISIDAAISVLLDVTSCIEDLAGVGSAHLNLKPANILVTNDPTNDRALVLGFGTSATLLHAGAGVPVPADDPHLAPELVKGNLLPPDQAWRSDLFSLGVIACGMLGAEIEADGYGRPRVALPDGVRAVLPEADPLEGTLGQIMNPNPSLRGDSPSDLRDSLIRAMPDPSWSAGTGVADATQSKAPFDPNKTDPAIKLPPDLVSDAESSGAKEGESTWPAVLLADPKPSVRSGDFEDTDVRDEGPADALSAESNRVGGGKFVPTAVPKDRAGSIGGRRISRIELAVVAAVVIVLSSIIAFTWSTDGREAGSGALTPIRLDDRDTTAAPTPPPSNENLFEELLAIQQRVDEGDLDAAREALSGLDDRDNAFSSDESALYDRLVSSVARASDRSAAIEDLRTGLDFGSVKMVRRGVAKLSGYSPEEISAVRGLAGELERARQVLRLHSEMWDAHRESDFFRAIEIAQRFDDLLPGYSGAADVRNQAAGALEARAEVLIADHQYSAAVAVLTDLRRAWPAHGSSAARVAFCEEQINRAEHEEAAIAEALASGEAGDPEAGLAALDRMTPTSRFQEAYDRARLALDEQLAKMDANEPTIEIATALDLGFKKNQTIVVPLKVSDDYRVEGVIVHARGENDDFYREIPLNPDGRGLYNFTISPELHGNKNVYFFVVANDRSGHQGLFGSRDEPQLVVRRRWFKKLG